MSKEANAFPCYSLFNEMFVPLFFSSADVFRTHFAFYFPFHFFTIIHFEHMNENVTFTASLFKFLLMLGKQIRWQRETEIPFLSLIE